MRRLFSPARLLGLLVVLALVTLGILWLAPSGDYILLPDPAHPVAPLVRVQGGHDPKGTGQTLVVDGGLQRFLF